MDAIAVQVRPAAPAGRGDTLGEHLQHGVVILARKRAVRVGHSRQPEKVRLLKLLAGHRGHDLLGQDIQRGLRDAQAIQLTLPDGVHQGGAFDETVPRHGEQAPPGQCAYPVARATDALQRHRDRARGPDLADEVHRADIDSQLKRRRGDYRPEITSLEPVLGFEAKLSRQASWCGSTASEPSRSASRWATRSDSRRVLTKIRVVLCWFASCASVS